MDGTIIKHLAPNEPYTYLGLPERESHHVRDIKRAATSKYKARLRRVWNSQLSGINKIVATNMLAVPILSYSFGVLKWTRTELRDLDIATRKVLTASRSHHPKASVQRLYLPRHRGGRGLLNLEHLHDRLTLGMTCRVIRSEDPLLKLVFHHELKGNRAFLVKAAERAVESLSLSLNITKTGSTFQGESIEALKPAFVSVITKKAQQVHLLQGHEEKHWRRNVLESGGANETGSF